MPSLDGLIIERTTAAQQIAAGLTQMVVAGELEPGQPLRESVLATRLGVSRNTIREAVRILEQSRLVHVEVGRGAVVRTADPDDVVDVYSVRQILEIDAIRDSRSVDLAGVRAALEAFDAAARGGAVNETVEHDLAFHASIVATLGSPRLDRFFADLCGELRFFLSVISVSDRETEHPKQLVAEHARVLEAWEAGDRRQAARLLREHLRLNAERAHTLLSERAAAGRPRR